MSVYMHNISDDKPLTQHSVGEDHDIYITMLVASRILEISEEMYPESNMNTVTMINHN